MTPITPECSGKCLRCCVETTEEITARAAAKRETIKEIGKTVVFVIGGIGVTFTFVGVVAFSCYCQYIQRPINLDLVLMSFLFLAVGSLIGVSYKEILQIIGRLGGKP